MKQGRNLVTTVWVLIILTTVACSHRLTVLRQGEAQLSERQRVKTELADVYLISVAPEATKTSDVTAKALNTESRERVRRLLGRFVELSEKILRLDEKKGIAVTERARLEAERDRAKALLTDLESPPAP